jgi:uncharacterized protein YoxC
VTANVAFHALLQTDPALLAQLERIALAQTVLGVLAALLILIVLGGAVAAFLAARRAAQLVRRLEQELTPRVDPLIERATRIADDANDVSDTLRRKVHELTATLDELNVALRRASRHAQQRVREFGAVVDVVQEEAETLLLDAAATARGVHTTAESLRTRAPRAPRHRDPVDAAPGEPRAGPAIGDNPEVL